MYAFLKNATPNYFTLTLIVSANLFPTRDTFIAWLLQTMLTSLVGIHPFGFTFTTYVIRIGPPSFGSRNTKPAGRVSIQATDEAKDEPKI